MKKNLHFILILFAFFVFVSTSKAQEQTNISEEKRKLIAELIVLTKMDQQTVSFTDTILASMQKTYPLIIEQILQSRSSLSVKNREKLKDSMIKGFTSFNEKFRKRFAEKIDYQKFIQDAVYPLYDKHFTEKELAEIVAFYKTETGKKVIDKMPQIFQESTDLSQKLLLPQVMNLVNEILLEELSNLEKYTNSDNNH